MSLPTLLTAENLRATAGNAFARGEAYWREGRVLSCVLENDALAGLVEGQEPEVIAGEVLVAFAARDV